MSVRQIHQHTAPISLVRASLRFARARAGGSIFLQFDHLGEAMRTLALVVGLISFPAFAGNYTLWADRPQEQLRWPGWLETRQGQACCKHCTKGKPCGNSCIDSKKTCRTAPGCAC